MIVRLALILCLAAGFAVTPIAAKLDNVAAATKKKVKKKSSEYSAAQRAKFMEEARRICKKRYGAGATVYKLDYYHWKVWCLEG